VLGPSRQQSLTCHQHSDLGIFSAFLLITDGLQAFDDQVIQVTDGVSRAIGSLWGTAVAGSTSLGQMVAGEADRVGEGAPGDEKIADGGTLRQRCGFTDTT